MATDGALVFSEAALDAFATDVFAGAGMPEPDAARVARALVFASLRGLDTHGVVRIGPYLERIRRGMVNLRPRLDTASPMPFSATIDADNAMGPVGAYEALELCMERARRLGIGAATVRRSNHFGAASAYTVPAAAEGFVALAVSPASKSLAPHGARDPFLGTNPLAFAAPAGRHGVWSMDLATSVSARGHIRTAARRGEAIPEGWALDREGRPTTDPAAALEGIMLPFAGAKGSAISGLVEILGGVLSGSAFAGEIRDWNTDFSAPPDVGHFHLVMAVEAFMPAAEFAARMETEVDRLKALRPAEGFEEVMFPGERSGTTARRRRAEGIPLEAKVVAALKQVADETGVPLPEERAA